MPKKIESSNIADYIPSKNIINCIIDKLKTYDELIEIINSWLKTFMQKIEHLKEKILIEKALLNKMILNFDKNFLDYAYYSNINYLYKYTNEIYSNLINKNTFVNKTKYLIKYLIGDLGEKNNKIDIIEKHFQLAEYCPFNSYDNILKKINEDYFFNCSENRLSLMTCDNIKNSLIELDSVVLENDINNYSFSNDKDDKNIYYIYICLAEKRLIKFFKANLKDEKIEKMEEIIKGEKSRSFQHCIYVGENKLATVGYIENTIEI